MCDGVGSNQPDDRWQKEFDDYIHGRLNRVQDAARSWLSTMTTLLSLTSTVIVIKGPTTRSDVHGSGWRAWLLVLACLVFVVAFAALFEGLQATWGGLGIARDNRSSGLARLGQFWSPADLKQSEIDATTPSQVRDDNLKRSNRARRQLHHSRMLGVSAAILAGLLALLVLANGVFAG